MVLVPSLGISLFNLMLNLTYLALLEVLVPSLGISLFNHRKRRHKYSRYGVLVPSLGISLFNEYREQHGEKADMRSRPLSGDFFI